MQFLIAQGKQANDCLTCTKAAVYLSSTEHKLPKNYNQNTMWYRDFHDEERNALTILFL